MSASSSDTVGHKVGAIILVLQLSLCLMTTWPNQLDSEIVSTAQALILQLIISLSMPIAAQ